MGGDTRLGIAFFNACMCVMQCKGWCYVTCGCDTYMIERPMNSKKECGPKTSTQTTTHKGGSSGLT